MAQNKITEMASKNSIVLSILYILIGLIMLACGRGSIDIVFWISGILYIIIGIVQIVLKTVDVKGGLITIIIGIIFLIIVALDFAEVCTGIILILSALPALLGANSNIAEKFGMQQIDTGNALVNKIITVVLLIIGIILIAGIVGLDDHGITDILIRVGGLVLLIVGILDLVKALKN